MVADTERYIQHEGEVFSIPNSRFGIHFIGENFCRIREDITVTVWRPWSMAPTVRQWEDVQNGY